MPVISSAQVNAACGAGRSVTGERTGNLSRDLRPVTTRGPASERLRLPDNRVVRGVVAPGGSGYIADHIFVAGASACIVSGNSIYQNEGDGILTGAVSTVSGNTAYFNAFDGIDAGSGSTVQRNTTRLNSGVGLKLGSGAAYRENVITNNTTGTVDGGVNMLSNSCNGATSCP